MDTIKPDQLAIKVNENYIRSQYGDKTASTAMSDQLALVQKMSGTDLKTFFQELHQLDSQEKGGKAEEKSILFKAGFPKVTLADDGSMVLQAKYQIAETSAPDAVIARLKMYNIPLSRDEMYALDQDLNSYDKDHLPKGGNHSYISANPLSVENKTKINNAMVARSRAVAGDFFNEAMALDDYSANYRAALEGIVER